MDILPAHVDASSALEEPPHITNCIRLEKHPYAVRIHSDENKSDYKFENISESEYSAVRHIHSLPTSALPRVFVLENHTFVVTDRTWIEFN